VNKEKHVPDWKLERYLLDELPRQERRQMEQELQRDPDLRAELEKLRQSDRQILSTYPAEQAISQILKKAALARPQPTARRRWRLAWVAAPALALALLLLVILPPILQRRLAISENSKAGEYTAIKGDERPVPKAPDLLLYRRGPDGDQILPDGATARTGDLLQVAYSAAGRTHGVILSIDGAGTVTLHFPAKENGDTALRSGRNILLPQSYELDRAPRFERFFFITATAPLPVAAILEKARQLADDPDNAMAGQLDLSGRYRQVSLLLRK